MTSGQGSKVPPIKLKLSLGSKINSNTPHTPTPGPSTPTPIIKLVNRKGKGTTPQDDDQPATPSNKATEGIQAKKRGKSKDSNIDDHSTSVLISEASGNGILSLNEENHAGPSRIPLPEIPLAAQLPVMEQKKLGESSSQVAPMTPTSSFKPKVARGSLTKKSTPRTNTKLASGSARRSTKSTAKVKPTAIPSRLFSESIISTPLKTSSVPPFDQSNFETPTANDSLNNSEATSPDPLSGPPSPSAFNDSPSVGTPHGELGYDDTPQTRGHRTGGRWMRIKRPLKELANRILVEMRRKDDYALFEEPVDLEAFPDYLAVIGGEEKMMDMGTMQKKIDNGEYNSIDQIESDLHLLVNAAQKFNPPGTIPYNAAGRVLTIGLKHIERAKPLVLTPSPSPSRDSATPFGRRGYSVFSGREGTAVAEGSRRIEDLPPTSYIPEQMLNFPPNSLQALAIGWNLNGGKRVHAKRIVRSREKFGGKWRNWECDGTRDLAEMDDVASLLDNWRIPDNEKVIDWKGLRRLKNDQGWWYESDTTLSGPTTVPGQPSIPFAPYAPRRDKIVEKERNVSDYGIYPDIDAEVKYIRKRTGLFAENEDEILSEHLRPLSSRVKQKDATMPQAQLVNIYENPYPLGRDSNDWIREMINGGDVKGEAYLNSIQRFVRGAMEGVNNSSSNETTTDGPHVKVEDQTPVSDERSGSEAYPLDQYVLEKYHDGLLYSRSAPRKVVLDILQELSKPLEDRPEYLKTLLNNSYAKIALDKLTLSSNPMDIKPLLRLENDFLHQGIGSGVGKNGIKEGLEWAGKEIERLNNDLKIKLEQQVALKDEKDSLKRKRDEGVSMNLDNIMESKKIKLDLAEPISNASSPLSAAPDSPKLSSAITVPKANDQNVQSSITPALETKPVEDELRSLRLELVALSKFYPLPALKKMRAHEAAKLLPANVRGLMTVPEDLERLKRDAERMRGIQTTPIGIGKGKIGK
ncbi:uncharacterized protein I206_100242 [Kwoniella pini CBS 10737]|uniref:Bromo domain-containing protein n=1 Tax=Kwoniella pini CBS 10737 TaxID=1296096 RepID=A0A1B9IDZ5_9TREE|nr:uncharacterized protein I206_01083 [Kwoniella pini CBS 10737]OCF53776.1 hypothetical protein I206_01083 [Kwoniella pini CBS 10737]